MNAITIPQEHLPIYRLEAEILKHPQVEMPVEHEFCKGLYARTMFIPAGTVLTGAVHADESFFLVRQGELIVTTDHGTVRMTVGSMAVTKANTKRAGVAMTDVVVTTFHANPTEERDPVKLWDLFTTPAPATLIEGAAAEQLENAT